jgi:hypothetical protein
MNVTNLSFEVWEDSTQPPSPSESYAFDGSRSARSFQVRNATPARRYEFAKAMLGYSKVLADGGRRFLHRQIPFGNPAVSDGDLNPGGEEFLWCKSIPAGAPVPTLPAADPALGVATWPAYRFSCEFRTCPYRVCLDDNALLLAQAGPLAAAPGLNALPDEGDALRRGYANTRYISRQLTPAVKLGVLKEAWLRFEATPTPGPAVPAGVPFHQFQMGVLYTWYEIPLKDIPLTAMQACFEAVNGAAFDAWAAGTLLLATVAMRQYASPLSAELYCDIEYHCAMLPNKEKRLTGGVHRLLGHNAIIANLSGAVGGNGLDYYYVNSTGLSGGEPPHPLADFSGLFRPEP